jgi:GAF domain-containing protein
MLARIRGWLAPPKFEDGEAGSSIAWTGFSDEQKSNAALVLHAVLGIVLVSVMLFLAANIWAGEKLTPLVMGAAATVLVTCVVLFISLRRGHVRPAGIGILLVLWGAFTLPAVSFGGMHDTAVLGYFVVVVVAAITLGSSALAAFTVLSLLTVVGLYVAEHAGMISPSIVLPSGLNDLILAVLVMITTAILAGYAVHRMTKVYEAAWQSAMALEESSAELEASRDVLAQQTRELERRARYLEATAAVARDTTLELDIRELLPRLVRLVSEQLGFYHVGIFFLEPDGEWLALQAASSEGGRRMLARGHRLRVGQGVVGNAAEHRRYRVMMDARGGPESTRPRGTRPRVTRVPVGIGSAGEAEEGGASDNRDVVTFFDNPDLPQTRSEAALPLMARRELIGVLDVQSTDLNAFSEEDLVALQAMANQLAVALSNARLYWEAQRALEAERGAYGELSRQAWRELFRVQPELAIVRSKEGILPISAPDEEVRKALQTGQAVVGLGGEDGGEPAGLAVPIRVRGPGGTRVVIGAIDAHKPAGGGEWTPEQIELLETLCEQLGDALDDARMYRDAQRRAAREQTLAEVAGRVRESLDVDVVLQRAVQEMRRALGVAEVEVRLDTSAGNGQDLEEDRGGARVLASASDAPGDPRRGAE